MDKSLIIDEIELQDLISCKKIKKLDIVNIEAQFIKNKNLYDHTVLDAFAQTGIFLTPKFYIVLKIETIDDEILTFIISKTPVTFGSNQYKKDKESAQNIKLSFD